MPIHGRESTKCIQYRKQGSRVKKRKWPYPLALRYSGRADSSPAIAVIVFLLAPESIVGKVIPKGKAESFDCLRFLDGFNSSGEKQKPGYICM
jgi:hypothetical protein